MPYHVQEKDGKYLVINDETGDTKAEHDTKEEAERQVKLLHEIENDPEWMNE